MALQTPEHSGRVRAVGGFITPKAFFKLPREKKIRITKSELMARDRKMSEKMQSLESEVAELKAMVNAQANHQSPIMSDKASVDQLAVEQGGTKPTAAKGLVLDDDAGDCVAIETPPPPDNLVK